MAAHLDAWTVVHHLYGAYFFAVLRLTAWEALAAAVAWELFESTQTGIALWQDSSYAGDTLSHAAVDTVATLSGWCVAWKAR